ncbi:hypothetical protein GCM10027299_03420 [Larkinella ripae]
MSLTAVNECPNCSAGLEKPFHYCPNCGQSAHLHRFNLPHIFHEIFHAFTHADKGVLYLVKSLTLKPGVVAREYILEGKRKKYFNPFTFLLLVLGLAVFVNSYFKPYFRGDNAKPSASAHAQPGSASPADAIQQRKENIATLLNKRANLIAFAAIPIFTLIFWLFFFRSGINYAEHLVANVFFAGYFQLVAVVVTVILSLFDRYISTINEQQLVFQLIYLPIGYYQFMNYHRPVKFLVTLLASLLALGVWVLLSSQAIRFYIQYGF